MTAWPRKVSSTDQDVMSYMTLLERISSPEVRSTGRSTPSGRPSVNQAWAEPHSVQ